MDLCETCLATLPVPEGVRLLGWIWAWQQVVFASQIETRYPIDQLTLSFWYIN